jgi:hypothetical protein
LFLLPESDLVLRAAIGLGIVGYEPGLISMGDPERGCSPDFFGKPLDSRLALPVRADVQIQLETAHEPVLDLNADLGIVDAFSGRVTYYEIR